MNLKVIKKVISFFAVAIWIILIFKIFQNGGTMQNQLPKCIFTTMITFGILTMLIKSIDYFEENKK